MKDDNIIPLFPEIELPELPCVHPVYGPINTYRELAKALIRDICKQQGIPCPLDVAEIVPFPTAPRQ